MKGWPIALAVFTATAVAAHVAVLFAAPSFIMDRAMAALAERGTPLNAFALAPRVSPQTQTVVRPSPDLAYLICRYDLDAAGGRLAVRMAAWPGYASLSAFDADTNNYLTIRGEGAARELVLVGPDVDAAPGEVAAPDARGVLLIRRLAPRTADYARVRRVAQGDRCGAAA